MCVVAQPSKGMRVAKKDGFFCVSPEHVYQLTNASAEAFCAYLVLSCGTTGNNSTTAWSAQAVSVYCGCRWTTAKAAVEQLLELDIIEKDPERSTPKSPKWRILDNSTTMDDRIWLPKSLVEGAQKVAPYPLQALREADDPLLIRLLMDLYAAHDLIGAGGVDPGKLCGKYKAEVIGERGPNKAWGFAYENDTIWPALSEIHKGSKHEKVHPVWGRLRLLQSLGFVKSSQVLMNKEGGDPMLCIGETTEEQDARRLLEAKAYELCTDRATIKSNHSIVLPIPAHIKEPVLLGVFRLVFRPHTKATAVWWAQTTAMNQAYLSRFGLLKKAEESTALDLDLF